MHIMSLDTLRERIRKSHPRTQKVQFNTLISLVAKGGSVLISLLLVPLTIDYLQTNAYGTWLTISSVVMMLSFLDIGIGNGLRNKLSEAISKKDTVLAKIYISSAYVIFGGIQVLFLIIFAISFKYIPWEDVLNTSVDSRQLRMTVWIVSVSVVVKMTLDIILYVLYATQRSGVVGIINLLTNLLLLVGTYVLVQTTTGNLVYIALATSVSPIVVQLIVSYFLFAKEFKPYQPNFKLFNWGQAKKILSLGYQFFLIQIAVIVLFYADNLIISQLFGPSEVTVYNVSYRYFNVVTTLFYIVITPFWSAFTEAYTKKDTPWMKRTYAYLQKVWVLFLIFIVCMVIIADPVYSLWVGKRVSVPFSLTCVMALNVAIICWNNITVSILNGVGKVRMQLLCAIFATIVNIPLAVYFGKVLNFGSAGVTLATCISLLPAVFLAAIQARKLVNDRATGIWAK